MTNKCPKCNNLMVDDEEDKTLIFCLNCGTRRPKQKNNKLPEGYNSKNQSDSYFDEFREQMTKDYYNMFLLEFLGKWQISSVRWIRLKKRWHIQNKRTNTPVLKIPEPTLATSELPIWSNNWPEAVMLKWLDVFERKFT